MWHLLGERNRSKPCIKTQSGWLVPSWDGTRISGIQNKNAASSNIAKLLQINHTELT
jgi:hypothetical protein